MPTDHIVSLIDQEIARLQRARATLAGLGSTSNALTKRPGRPKGPTNKTAETSAPASNKPAKRMMTAEGKARIAAAQKKRWAAQKQAENPTLGSMPRSPIPRRRLPHWSRNSRRPTPSRTDSNTLADRLLPS